MFRYLPLVFKNSLRNKLRTLLTIGSIAGSLALLGVLIAMYYALYVGGPATPSSALRLVTRNKVSLTFTMPIAYEQRIASTPGVHAVMAMQWFGGVYKDKKNFFARFAVEPEKFAQVYPDYIVPADQMSAFVHERTACLIGRKIADKYGLKLGDHMTIVGDIFPINPEFTVRGIYDNPIDDESMFFSIKYLFESLGTGRRDFAGTFAILANTPEDVPGIAKNIDDFYRNSTTQTKTETERAFQLSFVSQVGNIKLFLFCICAAVTFTILLVSANTMAMSVRERVKEVGVLKTLGYTNGMILGFILGEAAVISVIGGVLGTGFAWLATFVVRAMPAFLVQLKTLTLPPPVLLICVTTGLVIGVVSSFIPAYQASRTPILESLRYSG